MKRSIVFLMMLVALVGTTQVLAQKAPTGGTSQSQIDDDFGAGSDEFDFERYSNENVLSMIEDDMEFACNRAGLCTIHAVTSTDRRFTASFSFGEGQQTDAFGSGSTVVVGGGNGGLNCDNCPRDYWGVKLEFTAGKCTQTIKVPRSLYISMNRYMYDLMDETGNTRRGFDPAKEAMIMFYSTIMKEAKGCVAPK